MPVNWKKTVFPCAIILLTVIAYSNTFDSPFMLDDFSYIVENPVVKNPNIFLQPSEIPFENLSANISTHLYSRIAAFLTFGLNYAIGGTDVRGYHAVNLAIHLVNAVLVYMLALMTLKTPFLKETKLNENAVYVAFFSSALFAVHPIQTEAVTYISQRFTSLAAMFYLIGIALYANFRLDDKRAFYGFALLSGALAMITKEISFTLPLAVLLYETVFFRASFSERLRRASLFALLWLIPVSFYAFGLFVPEKGLSSVSFPMYQVTTFSILGWYLRLIVLPIGQNLDYDLVPELWFAVTAIASLIFMAALLGFSIRHYVRKGGPSPQSRLLLFGIFWFFLTLSVETLVPLGDIIFEHRAYLPSSFLFISISAAGVLLFERIKGPSLRKAAASGAVVLVLILAGASYARNELWRDPILLFTDTVSKSPMKPRPHYLLATALYAAGRKKEAIEQEIACLKYKPIMPECVQMIVAFLIEKKRAADAVVVMESVVRSAPGNADLRLLLAETYRVSGNAKASEGVLLETLRIFPENQVAVKMLRELNASEN